MAGVTGGLVTQPLGGGNAATICISSSQSQLFGIGRIFRGQSIRCIGSRRATVAVVRACSADSGEGSRKEAVRSSTGGLERRQLLVGSTAAAAAGLVPPAQSEPVLAPDLTKCIPATDDRLKAEGIASVQCCPPYPGAAIKDFVFPPPLPRRVRKPAHLLTDAEKATYNKAYASIQALPTADPRSFMGQANVHCAYCNYGYFQQDGVTPLQVHGGWLFFAFHRWYLYFHERILAKFANDPTFAIPYWEWDNQDDVTPVPNQIPSCFVDSRYPALNVGIRNTTHYPPALVDFTRGAVPQSNPSKLRLENTASLYQNIVSGAKTPSLFFGAQYTLGTAPNPGPGTVESTPHGPVHAWTGGTGGAGEDMGNFYSAGRDPTFYCHHSNVDRIWTVWKTLPGGSRTDFTDPNYLNATFVFYDENAQLVRVKVADALDETKLGYNYAPTSNKWKDYVPTATASAKDGNFLVPGGTEGSAALAADEPEGRRGGRGKGPGDDGPGPSRRFRRREDLTEFGAGKREIDNAEGFAFKLARPDRPQRRGKRGPRGSKSRSVQPAPEKDEEEEEILVIKGLSVPANRPTSFDVFINLPEADKSTSLTVPNYVGTYYNVPHTQPGSETTLKTNLRMGVGDTIKQLGITDVSEISVTLVPKESDQSSIVVEDVTIEYE